MLFHNEAEPNVFLFCITISIMIFSLFSFFGSSILISIVLQFVGILWYGPLFGGFYLSVAHPSKTLTAPSSITYILCFLYTLLSVCIIGFIFATGFAHSVIDIILFTSILTLLIAAYNSVHDLFDNRPLILNILHSGYNFVLISITSSSWFLIVPHTLTDPHL